MIYRGEFINNAGITKLVGTIAISAGNVPTADFSGGVVVSVARNSKGKYTLTLSKQYKGFYGIEVAILKATDAGIAKYQVLAETVTTTKTIQIGFYNHNSPADLLDPTSSTLYVQIYVDNELA
jgi:hypothetical protein